MGLPCFGVAFWSSLMARAACLGEMSRAVSIDKRVRSGARRVIISTQFRLSGSGGARGRATPGMVAAALIGMFVADQNARGWRR